MSKTLDTLFQSKARTRLLKFFFRNGDEGHTAKEISKRIRENPNTVRKEIKNMSKIGLLIRK